MARVPRILRDWLHLVIGGRRQETPALAGIIAASASEYFEPRLLWGWLATAREAHARGIQLLRENLSPSQNAQYEQSGYFDVIGGKTGRRYRIRTGFQMNVHQLDKKGRPVCALCFMPEGELVVGDVMLAQKLALELFESDTLKAANKFSPDPYPFGLP
jgi:hypothetical protein